MGVCAQLWWRWRRAAARARLRCLVFSISWTCICLHSPSGCGRAIAAALADGGGVYKVAYSESQKTPMRHSVVPIACIAATGLSGCGRAKASALAEGGGMHKDSNCASVFSWICICLHRPERLRSSNCGSTCGGRWRVQRDRHLCLYDCHACVQAPAAAGVQLRRRWRRGAVRTRWRCPGARWAATAWPSRCTAPTSPAPPSPSTPSPRRASALILAFVSFGSLSVATAARVHRS